MNQVIKDVCETALPKVEETIPGGHRSGQPSQKNLYKHWTGSHKQMAGILGPGHSVSLIFWQSLLSNWEGSMYGVLFNILCLIYHLSSLLISDLEQVLNFSKFQFLHQ